VTLNNTNGGSNFDTTRGAFDPNVLGEYLNWTGNKGGPLVTSNNITARSDLRLYESDQNATMRALFAKGDDFLDTCVDLMGRAMNTVPAGVQLGQTIDAIPVKPINVTFDFDADGRLKLSGNVRVLTSAGDSPLESLTLGVSNQDVVLAPETSYGSSVFGRAGSSYGRSTYFPFSTSGSGFRNATSFSLRAPGISTQSFTMSSQLFVVPSLTTLSDTAINVTVAITAPRLCGDLTVQIAAPFPQRGTLAPMIRNTELAVSELSGRVDGYTVCHGQLALGGAPTGLITIKALVAGDVVDTLLLNGGGAGW
jgi:hypothetical protein